MKISLPTQLILAVVATLVMAYFWYEDRKGTSLFLTVIGIIVVARILLRMRQVRP